MIIIIKLKKTDPQVALLLLHQCGAFCKMVHLAHSPPLMLWQVQCRCMTMMLNHVLVPNWVLGKPVAFNTSVLNTQVFLEASVAAGSAALAAQIHKHGLNDERCRELG